MEHSGRNFRPQVTEYGNGELGAFNSGRNPRSFASEPPLSTSTNGWLKSVVSVQRPLEKTCLLRTRYLWVYFHYPTRQYPPNIPRTRPIGSDRHLKAKGQLCGRTVKGRRNVLDRGQFLRSEITDCNRLLSSLGQIQKRIGQLTDSHDIPTGYPEAPFKDKGLPLCRPPTL